MQRRLTCHTRRGRARAYDSANRHCDTVAVSVGLMVWAALLLVPPVVMGQIKYAGGQGTVDEPYLVYTAEQMRALAANANDWDKHFKLMADVDMNDVSHAGWLPIGDLAIAFTGSFDGSGKTVSNLTCVCPGSDDVALFGYVRGRATQIRNVRLVDPHVDAGTGENVAALLGRLKDATVANCHVERAVILGYIAVGGLVGWNEGTVIGCSVQGEIVGDFSVGGLVGINGWDGEIRDCFADAQVTGISRVGGLVGGGIMSAVDWSATAGRIEGRSNVGGLIGCSDGGITANCYSTASVTGRSCVGGLVGHHAPSCDCSSGRRDGEIHTSYSTGPVTGDEDTGGLIGLTDELCIVEGCFWDVETSGLATSAGGTGLTTKRLHMPSTFMDAGWDFMQEDESDEFWVIRADPAYPRPAWQLVEGDFDDDGDVDLRDFSILARRWRRADATFWIGGADLAGDVTVDARDLAALCGRWLERRTP